MIKHKVSPDGIKPRGSLTRPEYAGEQNMKNVNTGKKSAGDEYKLDQLSKTLEMKKSRSEINREIMKMNREQRLSYWKEDTLRQSIDDFFEYCVVHELVPSKPLLRVWFNCSPNTLTAWSKRDDFFGDIIGETFAIMETLYFNDLDNRAVPNMFRLKSSFGYVETQKVEVDASNNNQNEMSTDEIDKAIDNLIFG